MNTNTVRNIDMQAETQTLISQLEELHEYLERSYQGALDSDPIAFSGAARVAFADYVIARVEGLLKMSAREALAKEGKLKQ